MRRFRSHYPPVSFQGIFSKQWYIICSSAGDGWVKVDRSYSWNELEKLWDKIEYGNKVKVAPTKTKSKEYKVAGSKGNTYKVVNDAGIWNCSCPAHGFGRGKDCKHIKQIKDAKK
jgi:hypothetical protein